MGRTASPAAGIRSRLKRWAGTAGLAIDEKGYTRALDDNFYQPLTACTVAELKQGDGAELGEKGRIGKIQALHSSSALCCNLFDYWRGRDTATLATALKLGSRICSLQFEAKFPTGLGGRPPNLDLLLGTAGGDRVGIESKFLEPYGTAKPKPFKEKYFPEGEGLWERAGLPQAQQLAQSLRDNPARYQYLDAQQLLKHLLGIGQRGEGFSLLYLWFDPGGDAGRDHAAEADAFVAALGGLRVGVASRTYQSLYNDLRNAAGPEHGEYLEYLGRRYFPEAVA